MTDSIKSDLRARQQHLVIEVSMLKRRLHEAKCQLIQVDRQLGELRDLNPPSSGRSDAGLGL